MLEVNDRPVLVDCVVDPDDMVFPMVPAKLLPPPVHPTIMSG